MCGQEVLSKLFADQTTPLTHGTDYIVLAQLEDSSTPYWRVFRRACRSLHLAVSSVASKDI